MAAQGAMSVQGGNWRIFHKMVEKSGAAVALNTSVVGIEHLRKTGTGVSQHPQYTIRTESVSGRSTNAHPVAFHRVIIASPYQFSNISAGKGVLSHPIDEIPYVQLHVTIFASPYRCSPQFFNLRDGETVPGAVLTTLDRAGGPTSGPDGAGKAGFFSITILRTAVNPVTNKREYIYKIFSPRRVTPQFLRSVSIRSLRLSSLTDQRPDLQPLVRNGGSRHMCCARRETPTREPHLMVLPACLLLVPESVPSSYLPGSDSRTGGLLHVGNGQLHLDHGDERTHGEERCAACCR